MNRRQPAMWPISRQATRAAVRRMVKSKLMSTDFPEERVAVRDSRGRAIIHRPDKAVMRDMMQQAFKYEFGQARGRMLQFNAAGRK